MLFRIWKQMGEKNGTELKVCFGEWDQEDRKK